VELYFHSAHTSSGHGASVSTGYVFMALYLVKHRDNFTLSRTVLRGPHVDNHRQMAHDVMTDLHVVCWRRANHLSG
jgi:hypothetical protein